MKTWTISYTATLNQNDSQDFTFSVTQRFPPTMVCAKQLARNHVDPILHSNIALSGLRVNWIVHTAN